MTTIAPPSFLGRTAIVGVGYSELSRGSGRSVLSLALDAVRAAIDDAGLDARDVNGIGTFAWEGDSVPAQAVATGLAVPGVTWLLDLAMGGQAPCYLAMNAAMAIDAGMADTVVIYRALNGRSGPRVGTRRSRGGAGSHRYPAGLVAYPQSIAMWARRYLEETGCTEEDMAAVPLAQRKFAALNERAMVRSPLTMDDYLASRMVADPFRVPDCTIEVDGACAVVLTSLDRARDLRNPPVILRSAAYQLGPKSGLDAGDCLLWEDYTRNYTSLLADRLWGWAGMRPGDVDIAELYDCFSSSVLLALEGLGFAERGGAADFIRRSSGALDAPLPVNTHGGLLAEGYLHGMNTLAEAVLQLQGRCGERNVPGARTAVVTSGAMMDGSALVLGRE